MILQLDFTGNTQLNYRINTDVLAVENWVRLMNSVTVNNLCPINHKSATANKPLVNKRIRRLYELADILNEAIPNAIIRESLDVENKQEVLNRMHVHFPNIHLDPKLNSYHEYSVEYNDIIHWLENEFKCVDNSKLKIFLDFNKLGNLCDIDPVDYKWFTPITTFGDLSLHYTHVGRHARELFSAKDLVCPKEQFVPQSKHSASCVLWFSNRIDETYYKKYMSDWKKFYTERGGKDFFGYEFDDPAIRFGYIKLGEIETVVINGQQVGSTTLAEMNFIRDNIVTEDLISFNFGE